MNRGSRRRTFPAMSDRRPAVASTEPLSHQAIRWSWTVLFQAGRLHDAEDAAAATSRRRPQQFGEPERAVFHRLDAEAYFMLLAARQLQRVLRGLHGDDRLPGDAAHVRVLRDVLEHLDNLSAGTEAAYNRLVVEAPWEVNPGGIASSVHPRSHFWGPDGTLLGGVVRVADVEQWAGEVYAEQLAAERAG